jgi:hypothetical protein
MKEYEKADVEILFFESDDVVANSENDSADDFGGWHGEWFAKNNG